MYDPSLTPAEQEQVRNARIRRLRAEREGSSRRRGTGRRFQPLVLLGWLGGVIALTVIVLYLGILALSPAIMTWIEARPTLIQNELVVDFVNWYDPDAIADRPASDVYERKSIEIPPGATDTFIGDLLVEEGLIHSELAFHYQVYQAEPRGRPARRPVRPVAHLPALVHHRRPAPGVGTGGQRSPSSRGCASRSSSRSSGPRT